MKNGFRFVKITKFFDSCREKEIRIFRSRNKAVKKENSNIEKNKS